MFDRARHSMAFRAYFVFFEIIAAPVTKKRSRELSLDLWLSSQSNVYKMHSYCIISLKLLSRSFCMKRE
jgi:hypothetical protein